MNKRIKLQDDFDDILLLQSKFGGLIVKLAVKLFPVKMHLLILATVFEFVQITSYVQNVHILQYIDN